jgi:AraC-like DNA-binding protein
VHYGAGENPIIEVIKSGGRYQRDINHTCIAYILEGETCLSVGEEIRDHVLTSGDIMLFAPGNRISGESRDANIMILRIMDYVSALCDKCTVDYLYRELDTTGIGHTHLECNKMIRTHLELLAENIEKGLLCVRFMAAKVHELLFYLRVYHSDEELAAFNLPLLSPDARFMEFIWSNYREAPSVKQFAQMSNMSLAAFKNKFKTITGVPPSQWLEKQRVRNVYHEISCGEKTLKEISHEFHFSSVSHLGVFCHKYFDKTPGELKSRQKSASI